MTKKDFQFLIDTKKELEFDFNGITYSLNYGKDNYGKDVIIFGRTFEGKSYEDLGTLLNTAKIDNKFFREIIEDL
ncbi:MAG: hypothetical protein SOT46_09345 [Treponema sp.]|nr:hypothetical protein [Spirochaetia bacterium]MDY2840557.1 hypothetical protein [Treponema sp.]MDY5123915.1 hypothetical protein [Treponema sp.]